MIVVVTRSKFHSKCTHVCNKTVKYTTEQTGNHEGLPGTHNRTLGKIYTSYTLSDSYVPNVGAKAIGLLKMHSCML